MLFPSRKRKQIQSEMWVNESTSGVLVKIRLKEITCISYTKALKSSEDQGDNEASIVSNKKIVKSILVGIKDNNK